MNREDPPPSTSGDFIVLPRLKITVLMCYRLEAGTSGFLSISDSDSRVPAELGQESQTSSCVE